MTNAKNLLKMTVLSMLVALGKEDRAKAARYIAEKYGYGFPLSESVKRAKDYISDALLAGLAMPENT